MQGRLFVLLFNEAIHEGNIIVCVWIELDTYSQFHFLIDKTFNTNDNSEIVSILMLWHNKDKNIHALPAHEKAEW